LISPSGNRSKAYQNTSIFAKATNWQSPNYFNAALNEGVYPTRQRPAEVGRPRSG
jgi:hypothetical protein